MINKLLAILKRDLISATSYRLAFISQFFLPFFVVVSFFFLSRLLGEAPLTGLQEYGGEYFPFVLVGVVFTTYANVFQVTIVSTIRRGQTMGTLEMVLTSRTNLPTYLAGSSIYALLQGSIMVVLLWALGIFAFGVTLDSPNLIASLLVLGLSMATMVGLGIFSGSFVLVYKQGDPFTILINLAAFILSGVVYPIAVLPRWLQAGSALLPHTYALDALRLGLLQGASFSQLSSQLGVLALFAVGSLTAGYLAFTYAVRRAKVEGSLSQY